MSVDVYYNLHKKCWSIRNKGKVISHLAELEMSNVSFRVQPGGRAKAVAEQVRNVHAFARGEIVEESEIDSETPLGREITYNPFKYESFVYADDGSPVHQVAKARFLGKKVYELEAA